MIKTLAIATLALALAGGAQADTVILDASGYSSPEVDTSQYFFLATPFDSPASAGTLAFALEGYDTLDGQNFFEDDFTLTVNGVDILAGTFNLGGGGKNVLYTAPTGTRVTGYDDNADVVTGTGGALDFVVPIALLATGNQIVWSYDSLPRPDHAGFQGLGDEGWGISNITVSVSDVPEPGSVSLMLAGLGVVGGLARRRRPA